MSPRAAGVAFFLVGPCVEMGLGPWLLTGGWERGDPWAPAQAVWTVLGGALVAAGIAVVTGGCVAFLREGRGTPAPAAPTTRLVVRGAYRYVRNPMYLATAAVIAGEGMMLARAVLLVAAAAYLTTLAYATHRWEEPALHARFGATYERYCAAVPAWRPRRRPWSP